MNDFIVFLKSLAPTETELQVGAVGGVVGPFIAYCLGWSNEVIFLFFLMAIDFFTGMAASIIEYSGLSSKKGLRGVLKKFVCLAVLAAVHRFEVHYGIGGPFLMFAYAFITNELVSILENARRSGINVPAGIDKILIRKLEEKKDRLK